jgi:signal transduction histidine kinase
VSSPLPLSLSPAQIEALNRQITVARLLSASVHDARNGLQGVTGAAELLLMSSSPDPAKQRDRVATIGRQAAWLGGRFEGLLAFLSDVPWRPERLDLARTCTHAMSWRRASWGRLQVQAEVDVPAGIDVSADLVAVTRILLLLLLNAERALGAVGGGVVRISCVADLDDADAPRVLVVEDGGPGVAPAVQSSLFDACIRPSTGIATGLWTARYLAERLGGSLTWGGPDAPSRFSLSLPSGR